MRLSHNGLTLVAELKSFCFLTIDAAALGCSTVDGAL